MDPLTAAAAGASIIGGLGAAKAQKGALKAQEKIATRSRRLMDIATPAYSPILQYLLQNAGLGPVNFPTFPAPGQKAQPTAGFGAANRMQGASIQPVGGQPSGMDQLAQMRMGTQPPAAGLPNSALGIYGSNPADVYRLQQAEEDVNRLADQRARMLQYRLGQQGLGNSATAGAALARNEEDALTQLANFRRQLAINAGQEQQNRVLAALGALSPGLSGGQQAAGIYGNLGQQYGSQFGQAMGGLGDLASSVMMMKYLQPQGGGGGGVTTPPFGGAFFGFNR